MTSPGFRAIKSPSASGLVLILPVVGQKVKCIGPGAFEVGVRRRQHKPAGSADRTAIAAGFRHDVDTRLEEL